jgi:hypothetical protein
MKIKPRRREDAKGSREDEIGFSFAAFLRVFARSRISSIHDFIISSNVGWIASAQMA